MNQKYHEQLTKGMKTKDAPKLEKQDIVELMTIGGYVYQKME